MQKFVNPRLLGLGIGIMASTFAASILTDKLAAQNLPVVKDYAKETVGAGMTVAGTMLMRDPKTRFLGTALGGVGVAYIARGLVNRVTGLSLGTAPAAASNGALTEKVFERELTLGNANITGGGFSDYETMLKSNLTTIS